MRRKTVLCLALLLALALSAGCARQEPLQPAPTPAPVSAPSPTPAPTPVPDTPAARAAAKGLPEPPDVDVTSWEFLVANSYNSIAEYEIPYGGFEGEGFDARAQDALAAFIYAGREAGYPMWAAVTYRNYDYNLSYFAKQVAALGAVGAAEAKSVFHAPGISEHQTGLAVDITEQQQNSCNYYPFDNSSVLTSDTYAWALEHCAEYGFILRYPEGKEAYYGAPCQDGHFRYVGVEAATYIMENDLCLEEFLLLYGDDTVYVPSLAE